MGQPSYDLDEYVQIYTGPIKVARLGFIARNCAALSERALELAIEELKKSTKNVHLYKGLVSEMQQVNPANPHAVLDNEWITTTNGHNNHQHEQLEKNLQKASTTVVNSAIADAHGALADYFIDSGNYSSAIRHCHQENESRVENADNFDASKLSWLNLLSDNMSQARALSNKRLAFDDGQIDEESTVKLRMIQALGYFHGGDFEDTAASILRMESTAGDPTVASASDMAIICALCAMACFDRESLKFLAHKDPTFAGLTEDVPYVREMVVCFLTSNYSRLFDLLQTYENDMKLDMYISKQLGELYRSIRSRAMTQYLSVFSELPISTMSATFGQDDRALLLELKELIEQNNLNVKIDCKNEKIVLNSGVGFGEVYEKTTALAETYRSDTRVLMWSAEVLKYPDDLAT